ncbi:MAG: DNA polymerase III subunit beta [Planctomycetota bacterium]|nr:MAG: DNA polymerase III subunit beta [Planctomycetota bacterium]
MIRCSRKELLNALQTLSGILPSKSPKPILENVLFHPLKNTVEVLATDLEVGIKLTLTEVEVIQKMDFLVPGQKLLGILKESEADTVAFEMQENHCKITLNQDIFNVLSLSPEEFPQIADFQEKETFSIPSTLLRNMIRKTSFATANEATRYTMNGLLMDNDGKTMKTVATDGKRLAYTQCKSPTKEKFSVLLPPKGFQHIEKVLSHHRNENASLLIKENQLLLKANSTILTVQLLQGNFPPYQNVIPKGFPLSTSIHKNAFTKSLKKALLLTIQESQSVRLHFEEKTLTLFSHDPSIGEATVFANLEEPIAEPLDISFNPTFFLDVLKVLEEDIVHLSFKDSTSPGVIQEKDDFLYVVMPLNL